MIGAVDIGGTKIAVGIVDDAGNVLARTQAPTDPNRYADGLQLIATMLRETAATAGAKLSGIGIVSTGPVDPIRGEFGDVVFPPAGVAKVPSGIWRKFSTCASLSKTMLSCRSSRSRMGCRPESLPPDLRDGRYRHRRRHGFRRQTLPRR